MRENNFFTLRKIIYSVLLKDLAQMYYSNVLLKCITQMYYSNVLVKCITQMY
jgi:hypothetical protein